MSQSLAATVVMRELQRGGFEAFLVGGCVRDIVLGRNPKDFDITTNARPEQVQAIFDRTLPVGVSFGVVIVLVDVSGVDHQIEVATYRTDGQYSDGRRPDSVEYGTSAKDDVQRRDFTMNGLLIGDVETTDENGEDLDYIRIFNNGMGGDTHTIVDHVGGFRDIQKKIIRCIGDPAARFAEDALRMLRAVRFAAQLGFDIEENTLKAIEQHASSLQNVSRERVAMELYKMVSSPFPLKGLVPFVATGLANFALPKTFLHTSRFAFTLQRFQFTVPRDPILGMAMLLADSSYAVTREVCESLKLSKEDTEQIVGAVGLVDGLGDTFSYAPSGRKRLARRVGLSNALILFGQEPFIGKVKRSAHQAMEIELAYRSLTKEDIYPKPLVTGDDLIAAGLKPSPIFRDVLYMIETEQLDGILTDRETALTCALEFAKK